MTIDTTIKLQLQKHYRYLMDETSFEVLGVFAIGSMNYGFWDYAKSDVDSYAIVIPTFENLCCHSGTISTEIKIGDEICKIKDIRDFVKELRKCNTNALECLFTKYYIIDPIYRTLFDSYFRNYREDIAYHNPNCMIQAFCGIIRSDIKRYAKDPKRKTLHNIMRLYYTLLRFENTIQSPDFNHCIRLIDDPLLWSDLWDIKYPEPDKENTISNHEDLIPAIKQTIDNIETHYCNHEINTQIIDFLDVGLMQIISNFINS